MKFEDALKAMREGKKVTGGDKTLIYSFAIANGYKHHDLMVEEPAHKFYSKPHFTHMISTGYLFYEDWEIVE